jgi:hypothetical protein
MTTRRQYPTNFDWHRDTTLVTWLKGLAKCSLGVTITFGTGRGSVMTNPTHRTVEEILRKGIRRVNSLCYRNCAKRKGYSIGAVTVIEGRGPFERIHAHIGFESPPKMSLKQFRAFVAQAFKPSRWIERHPHFGESCNQSLINYMLKLGQESLVPSCCFAAKHPVA